MTHYSTAVLKSAEIYDPAGASVTPTAGDMLNAAAAIDVLVTEQGAPRSSTSALPSFMGRTAKAATLAQQWSVLYSAAALYVELGEEARARAAARQLASQLQAEARAYAKLRSSPKHGRISNERTSPRSYSFVQVGMRPGVQGAPAFSIAPSRARRSVSTRVRSVPSWAPNASAATE